MFSTLRALSAQDYALMVVAFLLYVYIWSKSRLAALVLILFGFAFIAYNAVDWAYWSNELKLGWRLP